MRILLYGLNFLPEEIGIGKYSGDMVQELAAQGHQVCVVTTPPYYPHWQIAEGFSATRYTSEVNQGPPGAEPFEIIRCPLWVPKQVSGTKRIIHLVSFALSSVAVVFWKAIRFRPDVVMTVEPAAICMPTTWLAARLCGAKSWLHVQDFEVDAAFQLEILKQPQLKRFVLMMEAFLMKRFDRVSSISPNMIKKLSQKGVDQERLVAFPNWVDCEVMKPIEVDHRLRKRFGIAPDRCVALYAGNIGAKQGLEIIVDAARQLKDHPKLQFVICGRGAAYESLLQSARGLDNVQFLPLQPLERFNQLMNCADIHLLPQRADAADLVMPSKLTGMLATGRPVVTCAAEGTQIANVVSGHGKVVPPADTAKFRDAVLALADDEPLRKRLGAAARDYAVKHLGRNSILVRFISDLRELCSITVAPAPRVAPEAHGATIRVDSAELDSKPAVQPQISNVLPAETSPTVNH